MNEPAMSKLQIRKATRVQVKHKIALVGPSGSGKSLGARKLAFALAPTGRVAAIDSENGSLGYYADAYDFDTIELGAPYTTERYLEALRMLVETGYEAVVIDSLSHQWAGEGGILDRKGRKDKRGGNSYTNWADFTSEHERFKAALLNAPVHILGTIRAKQDYVVEENDRGKAAPRKLGMAPIQREGFEYEFGIAFELQMDHRAAASKDRTGLFGIDVATGVKGPFYGETVDLADTRVGHELAEWASRGEVSPVVSQEQIRAIEDAVARVEALDPAIGIRFRQHWTINRFKVLSSGDRANDALRAISAKLVDLERASAVRFADADKQAGVGAAAA